MDLIERILERGEFQGDPAWQEIARLLEVRKSYELKLEELSWQVKPSNLSQIEFYSFCVPKKSFDSGEGRCEAITSLLKLCSRSI